MENLLKMPGAGVDFHAHTLASDGLWTPETLVAAAKAAGVKVMTVSDHDTIGSVAAVRQLAEAQGIQFVPGVEITINWRAAIYHLLVFNYDPKNADLNILLNDTRQQIANKHTAMITELRHRGYKLTELEKYRKADGHLLDADIAKTLYKAGEVPTFDMALQLCTQVGMQKVISQPADKVLAVAVAAGGVPVLAHPGRAEYAFSAATPEILRELRSLGLIGLEAYHPSHSPQVRQEFVDFAQANQMLISAGNDSHSEARPPTNWNPELVRGLLERLNVAVPSAEEAQEKTVEVSNSSI